MRNSTFNIFLTAGNKSFQNIAALISIGGSCFALITALQDGSRLEILVGVILGIFGQVLSFASIIIGRHVDEKLRADMEKRYEELRVSLENTEKTAYRLNNLLTPRTVNSEHHENFIKGAQSIERLNAGIKVVFDSGFDSASLANEIMVLFRAAGWQAKDGGSLLAHRAPTQGISVSCLPSYKRAAEPIAELLRQSGLEDVVVDINQYETPWEVTIYVFRANNKLGSNIRSEEST